MISVETARQLLDFGGGSDEAAVRLSKAKADAQLEAAVAAHNILERDGVAYLADEVGMGKTFVALGAFALFRHFNPRFRVLVIAPKENIQQKWVKEYRNFVRNNVKFADRRVKAIHQAPARSPVICKNLLELIRETSLDPDRDFFVRLSSFSLGLADDKESWVGKRRAILRELPWLDPSLLSLHSKNTFKDNFARAVCCALPRFDLVIIDEAHNLKGGLGSKAWRNRLLALTMGQSPDGEATPKGFRHYGTRARRLLLLSATPLEDDFRHVWNQLHVFGKQKVAAGLEDAQKSDEDKKALLSHFMIRRVNELQIAGRQLTKNLYRREWRGGGVSDHDDPLPPANDQQRLVVALVQKKVSELLESERFNNSFQIGMLASFESFLQTAKVKSDLPEFDGDQTEDPDEQKGIDVDSINKLASSYWKKFKCELPHPKMDALLASLGQSFETGEKALVFVRRVASVKELRQKLETEYDRWLLTRLGGHLDDRLRLRFQEIVEEYQAVRRTATEKADPIAPSDLDLDHDSEPSRREAEDTGGTETFFAWFFRGEGPRGVLSGAALAERLNEARWGLSSFFLDNWVAWLLDVQPGSVFMALGKELRLEKRELRTKLEHLAGSMVPVKSRNYHKQLFLAFQFAGLKLLSEGRGPLADKAAVVLHDLFDLRTVAQRPIPLRDWLETKTFFSELRRSPELRADIWPDDARSDFARNFRRAELRRELLTSMCRRGHPLTELWLLYVNQAGRLDAGGAKRSEDDSEALSAAFLALLENQRDQRGASTWRELHDAAEQFDLILDTNVPSLWERPLVEATTELGQLLREQQPVAGMSGVVNRTVVRQFRMPGYPRILVTTDILQEGEDLHLFCSKVYHYGISWMPSAMEQRTGRIDRVRSQTERRLVQRSEAPGGDDLLQVFYPYLQETVEVFQVNRVFERLNRFMRLMHERFGEDNDDTDRKLDVRYEAGRKVRNLAPISEPLKSAFPVREDLTKGPKRPLAVDPASEKEIRERFAKLRGLNLTGTPITWEARSAPGTLVGTLGGSRRQPFTLLLHSVEGALNVRCVSPVGRVDPRADMDRIAEHARPLRAKVCAVYDPRFEQYDLTVEGDVLLGRASSDAARVAWLIQSVATAADSLEEKLLEIDNDPAAFIEGLGREVEFER